MQRLLRMHIFDAGHTQRGDFEDNSLSGWRVRMTVGIREFLFTATTPRTSYKIQILTFARATNHNRNEGLRTSAMEILKFRSN